MTLAFFFTLPSECDYLAAGWYEGHVGGAHSLAGGGLRRGTTGVATARVARLGQGDVGESVGYAIKRRLLGPPLVNEQLREERLSKQLALGVLAPDGISSSAYGTEEILIEL